MKIDLVKAVMLRRADEQMNSLPRCPGCGVLLTKPRLERCLSCRTKGPKKKDGKP